MDIRNRLQDADPVVLMRLSPIEYAILFQAVDDMFAVLDEAVATRPESFKDVRFARNLRARVKEMRKEMEKESGPKLQAW